MSKLKDNGRFNELVSDTPLDAETAQAAINADKERRAREFADVLKREGDRLKCDLIAVAEIVGERVATAVRIVSR